MLCHIMVAVSNFCSQEEAIVCIHIVPLLRYKLGKPIKFLQSSNTQRELALNLKKLVSHNGSMFNENDGIHFTFYHRDF